MKTWRRAALVSAVTVTVALTFTLSACGGGGGENGETTDPGAVVYPRSQVLGLASPQSLTYLPAAPPAQAVVRSATAGSLIGVGATRLTADHVPLSLAGLRVACVSGNGSSLGVLEAVNPGVLSVSAAVLMSADWTELNADVAWAAAATAAEHWDGWENCGIKPEGAPNRSSIVVPLADGGYTEDVLVGNPSTNFTTVRLAISSAEAAEMRRSDHATTENPLRQLKMTWRVFVDAAGHRVWVERGEPASGAASGTQGFITLFIPQRRP